MARATEAGKEGKRSPLLVGTELALRAATRFGGGPAWWIQMGQVRESQGRWADARVAYERAADLSAEGPRTDARQAARRQRAHAHYRLARLSVRAKDWPAAERSYVAALQLRADVATWHGHRAQAREAAGDWAAAVDSFQEANRLEPDSNEWLVGLLRATTFVGKPAAALDVGRAALSRKPGDAKLARAMADLYVTVGNWPAAADVLREVVARRPTDVAARTALTECLQQYYRVPFRLDGTGELTMTRPDERADVLREAVRHLTQLVRDEPWRPGPAHKLGLLDEKAGEWQAAADSYQVALSRLATVDSWWCHRAAHEWAFRLAYVRHRITHDANANVRVLRSLVPAAPVQAAMDEPAGFFDAIVAYQGLQISGFLVPGEWSTIDINLSGQLLKRVRVDGSTWRPTIRFDLTNTVLKDFPPEALLTISARGRPLVTADDCTAVRVSIPGGSATVLGKIAAGASLTKKGSWPRTGDALSKRQQQYLTVYERARDALDAQGRRLFLCYGTLLGCHREGRFIPGDDDFDVSYISVAPDADSFRRECLEVARALLRRGLDINFSINGRLFKVGLNKVWIDVTPMWFYRNRAWAFDAHDLTLDAIDPVQEAQFLGCRVYVPRRPEVFLADTYGPDWRIPQSDFRYYRSKDDDQILSQMWSKPSEVREFAQLVEADRASHPGAGRFLGVGVPGYPGFSWLTSPGVTPPKPPSRSVPVPRP